MLYFIFIVASTLGLDFVLPAFTGVVAAAGYLGVATWVLSFQGMARVAVKRYKDQLRQPNRDGRYRWDEGTFAVSRGNGRDAPIPAIREPAIEARCST